MIVEEPTATPVAQPTPAPTLDPTLGTGAAGTPAPTADPTLIPTADPTPIPPADPTPIPPADPTPIPPADPGATSAPSPGPTPTPAPGRTEAPDSASPVHLAPAADPTPTPVAAPDDTYWPWQWAPDVIGARSAWALTRGRPEIVVAVVDTGADLTHPDLAGRLVVGTDIGDGDSNPTDEAGHGTHVAGIIAAASDNARGVAGIAPRVFVMPVKVMDFNGDIWDTSVAEGIAWAVARGARVINMSLGGSEASLAIDAAIDDARAHGVVVVAAAGNQGLTDGVLEPAAYAPVVAVAALEDRDPAGDADLDGRPDGCAAPRIGLRHASYSNTGPEVDLAAPGTCVLSTYPTSTGQSYLYESGTSMATPMVAAAAALVLSRNPLLTADEVETALIGTAVDLGTAGPDPETGAGLLQAGAAVASVVAPASDDADPIVAWTGITGATLVRGTLSIRPNVTDASPIVATRVYRDGHPMYVRRAPGMSITWASAGVPDGLHTWAAYGTDAGLRVGSASVRVLVANQRPAGTISDHAHDDGDRAVAGAFRDARQAEPACRPRHRTGCVRPRGQPRGRLRAHGREGVGRRRGVHRDLIAARRTLHAPSVGQHRQPRAQPWPQGSLAPLSRHPGPAAVRAVSMIAGYALVSWAISTLRVPPVATTLISMRRLAGTATLASDQVRLYGAQVAVGSVVTVTLAVPSSV